MPGPVRVPCPGPFPGPFPDPFHGQVEAAILPARAATDEPWLTARGPRARAGIAAGRT
jgi:hypothetical protein